MELDREVDSVLMNIGKTSGGVVSAVLFSATMTFKLVTFLMRMAKKGLVSSGLTDAFKSFNEKTAGEYTVYNIPLTKDKAVKMDELNKLNLGLEKEANPIKAAEIRNKIKAIEKEIPEIAQLKQLGIEHCVLPKLNGSNHTIQVAVSNGHEQKFKNWYLNHLKSGLSGGEANLEDMEVFTEGNFTILNMPFEEKTELEDMFRDFDMMKLNYAKCPDLSVGDGYTQIAIPEAERHLVENWFNLWKSKQTAAGKEVTKVMYSIDENPNIDAGEYTVYNIPLTKDKAEKMDELNKLNLELEKEANPTRAAEITAEIKAMENEIPEITQLKQLGIEHRVLPKLNGSNHTIQVAVSNGHEQKFKNWYLNHLTTGLSGGKTNLETIKVFTEGNYTILNMPFEGEELKDMLKDFNKMQVNYAKCPDLSVGDGYTQIAIPNADRNLVEKWFDLWKNKQIADGKVVDKEMYALDDNSYASTGKVTPESYIENADGVYQEANAEFEKVSEKIPWTTKMKHQDSPEFVKLMQDQNYERITINHKKLSQMDTSNFEFLVESAEKRGMFVTRIPYTWGEEQELLIIPRNQVFTTDDDKTYVAFLDKRKPQMHIDANGTVVKKSFDDTYEQYEKVKRGFKEVDKLRQGKGLEQTKNVVKDAVSKAVPPATPKV